MPSGQPFTRLCQSLKARQEMMRADLHVHTTYSDGEYSPSQVIDVARRVGLAAIGVTDHDSLAGIDEARGAARHASIELVAGVEITCQHHEHELHLLGYFIDTQHRPLLAALEALREFRRQRFQEMVSRLNTHGVCIPDELLPKGLPKGTLGRRHLAVLLVQTGRVGSVREAFARYLHDRHSVVVPKLRLPIAKAMALVRESGGVASWAHPPYDGLKTALVELRDMGLGAVEVENPARRRSHCKAMREIARQLDLAVTGGSDCHGPDHRQRSIGAAGVVMADLEKLRQRALG